MEMLAPAGDADDTLASLNKLTQLKSEIYSLFKSIFYPCYRRAYLAYENCRGLIGLKMPDGTDLIDA